MGNNVVVSQNKIDSNMKDATNKKIRNKFLSDVIRDKQLYFMFLPVFIWFIIFNYLPMYGIHIALKNFSLFKGIEGSPWVGIDNFITFFTGPFFERIFINTLTISLYGIIIEFPIPIILAILFNEIRNKHYKKITQTIVYIPHFVSVVVVVGMVITLLSPSNGLINIIISKLGGEKIYFLTSPEWFKPIYIMMNVWKEAGFNSVIFIAAIAAIDVSQYEAAVIDGANKFKQLIHVTIPGLLPTIVIMLILRIGNLLNVGYEAIILLYQPATYSSADVISTYVYRAGLIQQEYSLASAVGLFNGVIGLILVVGTNYFSNKVTENGLW